MSQFVLNKNHPLIPREHNYVLERKVLTVHSTDRDISKWPRGNYFEIDLPEDFTNVQSMRLVQITLPNSHYVFTNDYQNTKLSFSIHSTHPYGGDYKITISEGSYTAEELAMEIANKMNQAVGHPNPSVGFICAYNAVTNTFWFGYNGKMAHGHNFSLEFQKKIHYDIPCTQPEVWTHYSNWGLPAYLGYCRKKYTSTIRDASAEYINTTGGFGFAYEEADKPWLPPSGGGGGATAGQVHVVDISGGTDSSDGNCCQMNIHGETTIYMEIERYNSMDELVPWSVNTMGSYNNDYSGKVNSAFAKIPIGMAHAFALYGDSKNYFLMNSTTFTPPLERINRLRFKFRFHDGRLVDFKCVPFNFSLEINMLRDQPAKKMNVRVPASFIL